MPKNKSYFIAITPPEPLNTSIENIKKEISILYGTKSVLKSPPHLTIVPPFFWGNEADLLTLLQQFTYPEFCIQLNGFKRFELGVVFIDTINSEELYKLHTLFNAIFFSTFPTLKKKPFFPFHPHITVGNRDWEWKQFNRCWDDKKEQTFIESFPFKKLSLLKNIDGMWKEL